MGRRAYEVFGGAVEGMDTYVFSRTLPPGSRNGVTVLGENGLARLRELRAGDGNDIWLFGDTSLFGSLAAAGMVELVELNHFGCLSAFCSRSIVLMVFSSSRTSSSVSFPASASCASIGCARPPKCDFE